MQGTHLSYKEVKLPVPITSKMTSNSLAELEVCTKIPKRQMIIGI